MAESPCAGLMPTEARSNYLPEAPYLRETKTYLNYMHASESTFDSQPLESTRHAGNYFVPISIRPIFIFCCTSYVKLLDYWRAENFFSTSGGPPEACGICHICHMVNPALESPLANSTNTGETYSSSQGCQNPLILKNVKWDVVAGCK